MAGIMMQPAYRQGGGTIVTKNLKYADAASFLKGEVVKFSSGELVISTVSETGAVHVGVALQSVNTNPGYDAANSPTVVTGREQKVIVAVAKGPNVFKANLVNNSSTPVACVQANIGVSYGLRRAAAGNWQVDKNITATNDCVTIIDFDSLDPTVVFFTFNDADSAES